MSAKDITLDLIIRYGFQILGALIILMFVHVLFCAKFFGAQLTKAHPPGRAPADRQANPGTIHQNESSFLTKNQ